MILADGVLALGAFRLGGADAVALVLSNSALLLVDHVSLTMKCGDLSEDVMEKPVEIWNNMDKHGKNQSKLKFGCP